MTTVLAHEGEVMVAPCLSACLVLMVEQSHAVTTKSIGACRDTIAPWRRRSLPLPPSAGGTSRVAAGAHLSADHEACDYPRP